MNGYFQLINAEGQTGVCLYPPVGDGAPIDMNEVVDYLNFNGIKFSIPSLYSAAKKLKNDPVEITLSKADTAAVNEMCRVRVSRDGMKAVIRFYAPSTGGASLKKKDIISEIEHRGVRMGILSQELEAIVASREYCRDYEIARGADTKAGEDGRIEYTFEYMAFSEPDLLPDGSVDLRHLYRANECDTGEVLAKLILPVPPVNGYTVRGEEFPGEPGKEKRLKAGKNVELDVSDNTFKALSAGRVKLDKDRIFVLPLIKDPKPEGAGGIIDLDSSAMIEGDLIGGTLIKARGDVLVSGSLDASSIDAGGDVIICGSIDGRGKSSIRAGGCVFTSSIANAAVKAGSCVYSDVILNSSVYAGNKIRAKGPRGIICGGNISARNGVSAKVLGNDDGRLTIIETGSDPALKEEIEALKEAIKERQRVMEEAYPVLTEATSKLSKGESLTPSQLQGLKELHALYNDKKKEQKKDKAKLLKLSEKLSLSRSAKVDVSLCIYPGTKVVIGQCREDINERKGSGTFIKERDEVKFLEGEE